MREYYSVIQHAQCWWATTCGCQDEDSNPGSQSFEKSTLPLSYCLSLVMIYCPPFLANELLRPEFIVVAQTDPSTSQAQSPLISSGDWARLVLGSVWATTMNSGLRLPYRHFSLIITIFFRWDTVSVRWAWALMGLQDSHYTPDLPLKITNNKVSSIGGQIIWLGTVNGAITDIKWSDEWLKRYFVRLSWHDSNQIH